MLAREWSIMSAETRKLWISQ